MDGLEFLETVRDEHPELPFILFTGQGSEEVASDAITAGATDYLQKGSGTDQYELLANRIVNAVEKYRATERAAELDRIRTLASDVNQALVRASSRSEAEERVCEIISASDPYRFAWIGEVDPDTDRVVPRAWAGVEDGYLDEIVVSADDSPTGQGPGGTAIRERRIAISQNVQRDPEFEPWRDEALQRGYQAVAAIPLEYEDILYGILVVYAERPAAFDEDEKALLSQLGDDIATAIHSFEIRERLRRERDRRSAIFENAPAPMLAGEIQDGEHRITAVNEAFVETFGFEREEIIGSDPAETIVPEEGLDQHFAIREGMARGKPIEMEVSRITVNGPRTFLLQAIPYGEPEGGRAGYYAWYIDITERTEQEDELAHQRSLLESVIETSLDGILLVDEERNYVRWNQQFLDMWGVPEELIRDKPEELGLEWALDKVENSDEFIEQVEYLYEHPNERSRDRIQLTDGRVFDRYTAPVEGEDGTYYGRVWFFRDISEVDRRQEVLERLHEATRDLMAATSKEEIAKIASDTAEDVLQLPLNGLHLYEPSENALVPVAWSTESDAVFDGAPPSIPAEEGLAWRAFETGEPEIYADVRETDGVLNEDTSFRSELHLPLGDHGVLIAASMEPGDFEPADEALAMVLAANIEAGLDRVERERALAQERDKYETLIEQSHDAIVIVQDEDIVFTNERWLQISGYHESEMVGRPFAEFVVPGDREIVRDRHNRRIDPDEETPPPRYEVSIQTKGGEERVIEISAAVIQYEGRPAVLTVLRDTTDRHRYEEQLESTTTELEALNRLVRHDIRNDVSVILGWAEILEEHVDEAGHEYLLKLQASADHVLELTEIVRDYVEALTTDDAIEVRPTPLRSILETEIDLHRESTPEVGITVTGEIPDVEVRANEMLSSVFKNLLNNAIQHNDATDPIVEVSCEKQADHVVVRIADNGPGIPDEQKESIFGKGEKGLESAGTGIGLYLVQTLVDQYGGTVWVEDNEPRGAVFAVRLEKVTVEADAQ
ncbi:MAG: PAS domain S-box protein, partial [Salinirussus sp.]